jgi:bacterioferritin (cytochrome b1)
MRLSRCFQILAGILLIHGLVLAGMGLAQKPASPPAPAPAQPSKAACGPDHAILYKRAVNLLDKGEKKLAAKFTAEAKAMLKEANSLFTILVKECGPQQKERTLTPQEEQQEALNKKLAAEELAQAERLEKAAGEKLKQSEQQSVSQPEVSKKLAREAKAEFEQAQVKSIKAVIYSLRNQQMIFRFLAK